MISGMAVTQQPSGTVTLVFTDIEGSTRLLANLGPEGYREALADHQRAVRDAFIGHNGYEVGWTESFFVDDAEGPLADGELERARGWGATLRTAAVRHAA